MVPKINKELWVSSSMYKTLKDNVRKFQNTQSYLTAGLVPLVNLMDRLLKTNQPKEFEMAKDAFQLLAHAHSDITNSRRHHIRPGINEKYKQLCNDNTPLTCNLLGDDLESQLKFMDTMRKLSTDIGRGKQDFNHTKHQIRKRDHRGATVGTKYQQTQNTNHFFMEKRQAVQSAGREETGQTFPEINIPKEKISVSPLDIELLNKPNNFYAGKVKCYIQNWENLTKDRYILDILGSGYKLELDSKPTGCSQYPIHFSQKEKEIIKSLIDGLVKQGVIEKVQHEKGEIISNIFIRPKQDGSFRLILNLKKLNEHIEEIHFKMETLKSALNMVKKGVYFAKIYLKDAYFRQEIPQIHMEGVGVPIYLLT